jgi:hypothetical protein
MMKKTITPENKRVFRKTMNIIANVDFMQYTNARLLELDANLYYHCKLFIDNLKSTAKEL